MKKMISLVLVVVMVLGMTACGAKTETPTTAAPAATEGTVAEAAATAAASGNDNWKIAILTGTVSQGEEEFRAAEKALATYGPEHIVTATYPDNFMSEMETTVSQIVSFASDPDVKAIVMCQAVPGAKAGFDKVREMVLREVGHRCVHSLFLPPSHGYGADRRPSQPAQAER